MKRTVVDFLNYFVLPLVKGGELRVGKPISGPELELFGAGNDQARVLWLLPISDAERAYARAYGHEALETLFDERAIDYTDPLRQSVV